jgi:hypothetical protein
MADFAHPEEHGETLARDPNSRFGARGISKLPSPAFLQEI